MAEGRTRAVERLPHSSRYLLVREYADGFADGVAASVKVPKETLNTLDAFALGGGRRAHANTNKRSAIYRAGRRDSDYVTVTA